MNGAGYGTEGEFPEIEYRQKVLERVMAVDAAIPGARFLPSRLKGRVVQLTYWIEAGWRRIRGE